MECRVVLHDENRVSASATLATARRAGITVLRWIATALRGHSRGGAVGIPSSRTGQPPSGRFSPKHRCVRSRLRDEVGLEKTSESRRRARKGSAGSRRVSGRNEPYRELRARRADPYPSSRLFSKAARLAGELAWLEYQKQATRLPAPPQATPAQEDSP